jgi:energy-coupling factor transporter ATP-binding protein EcfA2
MLISLTVSNFRSIAKEQEFSMVASGRYADHQEHLFAIPDSEEKLLPAAVIYGANASGKSNLIKALQFIKELVTKGSQPGSPINRQPFRLGRSYAGEPSCFEIRFVHGNFVFGYGFRVTDTEVVHEWLNLMKGGREIPCFERVTLGGVTKVDILEAFSGDAYGDHSRIKMLGSIGARSNQLFLSFARESFDAIAQDPLVRAVLEWLDLLTVIGPGDRFSSLSKFVDDKPDFKAFAGEFLNAASTGISCLQVHKVDFDEQAPPHPSMRAWMETLAPGQVRPTADGHIERGDGKGFRVARLVAEHRDDSGQPVAFSLSDESDGTRRVLDLLPALYQAKGGRRVFVIDEIDRSLHPLLAKKFLEFFLRLDSLERGQMILTTHEANLMDLELLRRDEIWFTEKNRASETSVYSLSDFNIRTDLKVAKGYLQGRFGAIPFLGDIDRLAEKPAHPAEAVL